MARRRHRRFGEVRHRKWYRGPTGGATSWKKIGASIQVARAGETGAGGRVKPYRAIMCVGGSKRRGGFYPRLAAHRCGEGRGTSPTKAIKAALRDAARSFK